MTRLSPPHYNTFNTNANKSHKKWIVVMVSRVSDHFLETIKPININNADIVEKVDDALTKKPVEPPKPQDQYKCDICSKAFKTSTSLFEHTYRHCDTCRNLLPNQVQLKRHRKTCQKKSKHQSINQESLSYTFL